MSEGGSRRAVAETRFTEDRTGVSKVGGRSIHQYWNLLSPHFHDVFLAPQRRSDDSGVSWTWREPIENRPLSAADFSSVRTRLERARESFYANPVNPLMSETRSGANSQEIIDQVAARVTAMAEALSSKPDPALAEFVCRTETGVMVHSWGLSAAAKVTFPDATENGIAGVVLVGGKGSVGNDIVVENLDGLRVARTMSEENGAFRFPKLRPGRYRVRVVGGRGKFSADGVTTEVGESGVSRVELSSEEEQKENSADVRTESATSTRWRVRYLWVGAGVAILGVGGLLYWFFRDKSTTQKTTARETTVHSRMAPESYGSNAAQPARDLPRNAEERDNLGAFADGPGESGKTLDVRHSPIPGDLRGKSAITSDRKIGSKIEVHGSAAAEIPAQGGAEGDATEENAVARGSSVGGGDDKSTGSSKKTVVATAAVSTQPSAKKIDDPSGAASGPGTGAKHSAGAGNNPLAGGSKGPDGSAETGGLPGEKYAGEGADIGALPGLESSGAGSTSDVLTGRDPKGAPGAGNAGGRAAEAKGTLSSGDLVAAIGAESGIEVIDKAGKTTGKTAEKVNQEKPPKQARPQVSVTKDRDEQQRTDPGDGTESEVEDKRPADNSLAPPGGSKNAAANNGAKQGEGGAAGDAAEKAAENAAPEAAVTKAAKTADKAKGVPREPQESTPTPSADKTAVRGKSGGDAAQGDEKRSPSENAAPGAEKRKERANDERPCTDSVAENEPRSDGQQEEPSRPRNPNLYSVGTVRLGPWRLAVGRDRIIPTMPVLEGEQDLLEAARSEMIASLATTKPRMLARPELRCGLTFKFVSGATPRGLKWLKADEVTMRPQAGNNRAALAWPALKPPRNRTAILAWQDGTEAARITFGPEGQASVELLRELRASLLLAAAYPAGEEPTTKRYVWRVVRGNLASSSWNSDCGLMEGEACRLDLVLNGAAPAGTVIALTDSESGWDLVTELK